MFAEEWYVKDWHTRFEVQCEGGTIADLDNSTFTLKEDEANANLIVAAVNVCKKINPDNPMAAAEAHDDTHKALEFLTELLKKGMFGEAMLFVQFDGADILKKARGE